MSDSHLDSFTPALNPAPWLGEIFPPPSSSRRSPWSSSTFRRAASISVSTIRIVSPAHFSRANSIWPSDHPSWLNETVPIGDRYYSVFPLGAHLSVLPLALLNKLRVIDQFPGRVLAAALAGGCAFFFFDFSHKGKQLAEQTRPARAVSHLWRMDMVQSWLRRRVANRTRVRAPRRDRRTLFYDY